MEYNSNIIKPAATGGLAQAGRSLVGHFAEFWKFASRPCLCETPPERQAPDTLPAIWGQRQRKTIVNKGKKPTKP